MIDVKGWAAQDAKSPLKPIRFQRQDPGPKEVHIQVLFCGVCHSDIHQVKDEWGNTIYPCLPGHEIVGRVIRTGAQVTKARPGDLVGVGCMIDSCRQCEPCRAGEENYCEGPNSWLATYNGPMVPAAKAGKNTYGRDNTYGGYSTDLVVTEDFLLRIPAGIEPAKAAPILCAGVTTFSPLKHWRVKAGDHIAIIGFGGLGDMALKLAKALGAHVTVFTTSQDKIDSARAIGADDAVLETDKDALARFTARFDFMLSTVPQKHDLNPFVPMLKRDATLVAVGALEPMAEINHMQVAAHRRRIAGSLIGSLAETQEVLDFCAAHQITPDIELIPIARINEAYEHVESGDVRYRYVIDMESLRAAA